MILQEIRNIFYWILLFYMHNDIVIDLTKALKNKSLQNLSKYTSNEQLLYIYLLFIYMYYLLTYITSESDKQTYMNLNTSLLTLSL